MIKKSDYWIIIGYLGIFTAVVGFVTLLPVVSMLFYREEAVYIKSFLIPGISSIAVGLAMSLFLKKREEQKLSLRQDTVIVLMAWIMASIVSSLPFIISGKLNFTLAFFEAVSGWTTTGLSVVELENIEKVFLLHRSIMQFFGGIGIVLVLSTALSTTFSMKLYSAEGHSSNPLPNIAKSSRLILRIYSGYVISGTVLYRLFGMPLFDALNHSMAALSTGGFGITANSIGSYDSISIELVTIVLMLLGTTSFAAHILILSGKFKTLIKVGETRFMIFIVALAIPVIVFAGLSGIYSSFGETVRAGMFQVFSAISTTGFSTVDFKDWGSFANFIIIILMMVGGSVGSTSGGIKLYRAYIMLKSTAWSLKKSFLPDSVVQENYIYRPSGKHYVEDDEVSEANRYGFTYMLILFIGTSIIASHGYSIGESLFEFASSLGTVGLSVGITSPDAPPGVLWTQIVGMMLGRLEIYVVLIGIMKVYKDIKLDLGFR